MKLYIDNVTLNFEKVPLKFLESELENVFKT